MEQLKKILDEISEDNRAVNKEFKEKLIKCGFKIETGYFMGDFIECEFMEYIKIGTKIIWLVEEDYNFTDVKIKLRLQKDVIEDIKYLIEIENQHMQEEKKFVEKFFSEH